MVFYEKIVKALCPSVSPDDIMSEDVNHEFTFVNGIYTYKVRRNILGERDSPEVTVQVEKRGEIIFIVPGSLIGD